MKNFLIFSPASSQVRVATNYLYETIIPKFAHKLSTFFETIEKPDVTDLLRLIERLHRAGF